ncbi:MAG: hypothetical protein ABIJ27_01255 [Candidatus Omnitrophota bacterium]
MSVRTLLMKGIALIAFSVLLAAPAWPGEYPDDIESLKSSEVDNLKIYRENPVDYRQAMDIGARIVNLEKYGAFFVYWIPDGFGKLRDKRVVAALHGENGNAFRQLVDLCGVAGEEKFAVVSIQWGWPVEEFKNLPMKMIDAWEKQREYLKPDNIYEIMSVAIEYMRSRFGVDRSLCAWLGTGRAAGQSATYAFYDTYSKNAYFKLFIAVSGGVDETLSSIVALKGGQYGSAPIGGTNFYLWCGEKDANRRELMTASEKLIEKLGGTVQLFRIAPEGGDGFNRNREHQEEAVRIWKEM